MDPADITGENDFNEESVKKHRSKELVFLERGRCLNCDAPLKKGLYCDADCREDHEHQQKVLGKTRK